MNSTTRICLAALLATGFGQPSLSGEEPKKPTPAPAKAASTPARPAAPAPVAARPAPAPRPAPSALGQAQTLRRDQQRYGADTAGRVNYDGARRPTPATTVRPAPAAPRKTAAQIAAEQNKIPRAQTPANYKRKPTEPPKPR